MSFLYNLEQIITGKILKKTAMKLFIFKSFILLPFLMVSCQNELQIPPLMQFADGSKIETIDDWRVRRQEIESIFEQEVYGIAPEIPDDIEFSVVSEDTTAFDGKATKKIVNLRLKNLPNPIDLLIYYPNSGVDKKPAFLGLNFSGNYTTTSDLDIPLTSLWVPDEEEVDGNHASEKLRGIYASRWPAEMIVDSGFALITLYSGDIALDYNSDHKSGVRALYSDSEYTWGTIAAWSWGLSYVMNYLEIDDRINENQVAVIGHSRLGKAALWAGAKDERFGLVISNNSGCVGAKLSRRKLGERFTNINDGFPHWFCTNFKNYNDKEETLAVDQHQLLAMMAPRPVYVAIASNDDWNDPEGEFLSAYYASEIYPLYGLRGIESSTFPEPETPYHEGSVGYHLRTGDHGITKYDWIQYINFANIHFK